MEAKTERVARSHLSGVALLLAAGVFWSLNGALIKLLIDERSGSVDGVTIAFYRSLFAGLFLAPFARGKFHTLLRRRGESELKTESKTQVATPVTQPGPSSTQPRMRPSLFLVRPAAIVCVLFFTLMTVSFVLANTKTEAANAIILQYTSTFWIFGLSPWMLRERPRAKDVGLLLLAMTGIAIIFAGNASTDLLGLTIALASGLFYGLLTMMIRRLRDVDSMALTVANNLGSAIFLLPAVALLGSFSLSGRALILLIIMGVVQFGLPYYLYALALVRVTAYQAALTTLVEPVLVPVWAYLAVAEAVPTTTFVGGGFILAALLMFLRRSRASGKQLRAPAAPPS